MTSHVADCLFPDLRSVRVTTLRKRDDKALDGDLMINDFSTIFSSLFTAWGEYIDHV